jgi:hypothetical protein
MLYSPYVGTASYYTCSKGSGACATCNSKSTNQVAYPNLNNHPRTMRPPAVQYRCILVEIRFTWRTTATAIIQRMLI